LHQKPACGGQLQLAGEAASFIVYLMHAGVFQLMLWVDGHYQTCCCCGHVFSSAVDADK
jgi:hypothetical protein